MSSQRNNLLAGVLVTIAIIGTVVSVIFLAGGAELFGRSTYIVAFSLETGVSGLTPGAAVHVGGVKVGTVQKVAHVTSADGSIDGVDVTIGITKSIVLREGATPELQLPLLGSQGVINFPDVGTGAVIEPGSRMHGTIAAPSFLDQAGWGEDERNHLKSIMQNADDAVADVRSMTKDASGKWPTWSERIDSISANADATLAKGPKLAEDLQARVDQVKDLLTTAQGYLDENRDNVKVGLEKFRSITEKGDTFMDHLNGELKETALALLEKGKSALEQAQKLMTDLNQIVAEQRPTIRRTFANIRLAADQLRDTLIEVRRAPWRLIYRPDTRELNFELLYDSARSYAGAVSDLRAASESLESLMASGPDPQLLRQGSVADLLAAVQTSLENYNKAEKYFMDQLLAQPVGTSDQKNAK